MFAVFGHTSVRPREMTGSGRARGERWGECIDAKSRVCPWAVLAGSASRSPAFRSVICGRLVIYVFMCVLYLQ